MIYDTCNLWWSECASQIVGVRCLHLLCGTQINLNENKILIYSHFIFFFTNFYQFLFLFIYITLLVIFLTLLT